MSKISKNRKKRLKRKKKQKTNLKRKRKKLCKRLKESKRKQKIIIITEFQRLKSQYDHSMMQHCWSKSKRIKWKVRSMKHSLKSKSF